MQKTKPERMQRKMENSEMLRGGYPASPWQRFYIFTTFNYFFDMFENSISIKLTFY